VRTLRTAAGLLSTTEITRRIGVIAALIPEFTRSDIDILVALLYRA
jgi:hypothetical protein